MNLVEFVRGLVASLKRIDREGGWICTCSIGLGFFINTFLKIPGTDRNWVIVFSVIAGVMLAGWIVFYFKWGGFSGLDQSTQLNTEREEDRDGRDDEGGESPDLGPRPLQGKAADQMAGIFGSQANHREPWEEDPHQRQPWDGKRRSDFFKED